MADRVRLDTRPLRKDLTSRECSSIIGGVIGGLIMAWDLETTRDLVRFFARILRGDVAVAFTAEGAAFDRRPGSKEICSILGATVNALDENGRDRAAIDGLVWWAERTDEEWAQVVSPRPVAGGPA